MPESAIPNEFLYFHHFLFFIRLEHSVGKLAEFRRLLGIAFSSTGLIVSVFFVVIARDRGINQITRSKFRPPSSPAVHVR